jgi:hypothetical protein
MKPVRLSLHVLFAGLSLAPCSGVEGAAPSAPGRTRVIEALGRMPLRFEKNDGQIDPQVRFRLRGKGYDVFLTPSQVVLSLPGSQRRQPERVVRREVAARRHEGRGREGRERKTVRMTFVGAGANPETVGMGELQGRSHYFTGGDPKRWRRDVPLYERVVYRDVWRGIDATLYGSTSGQLETDFTVSPGASPDAIRLGFEGVRSLRLDDDGNLVADAGTGEIVQHRPLIYQEVDGERKRVSGSWVLDGRGRAGFRVSSYDKARPLVIDPVLAYATFLGGSGFEDAAMAVAVDPAGNAYVTGYTDSADFPTAGTPAQPSFGGGSSDAFVAKLSPTSALVYCTYLGGSGDDAGYGIAVDAAGNAYVTGSTGSTDFPTAGTPSQPANAGRSDAFLVKLDGFSSLVYSTYLGGSDFDHGHAIAVGPTGDAYVTGDTNSSDFPTAGTPSQPSPGGFGDAFVARLGPTSGLVYSTYLGGLGFEWARGIAVDAPGNTYVVGGTEATDFPTAGNPVQPEGSGGGDAFVTKLSPTSSLLYSTYLGGSGYVEGADGVAVDAAGDVYVTGITESTDFPIAGPPFQGTYGGGGDAFVTKLSLTSGLVYSSYLGGSGGDRGESIVVDPAGAAHVTGRTQSTDFPTAGIPFQPNNGGSQDAFVAKVSPTSHLVYSTYLGGSYYDSGESIATDAAGNAYVAGSTQSTETGDAFVAKFDWANAGPEVNLKVNGLDAVYPGYVTTSSPVRLTIDMTAGPTALDHYYFWWVGGTFYWLTSAGVSKTPAPLVTTAPLDLTEVELFRGFLRPGVLVVGWVMVDGASVVDSDAIAVLVTP